MARTLTYLFLTIFFLAFVYLKMRGISHYSDDVWFSAEAHTPDIIKWLKIRYETWSSRTPIEFALLNLINHKQTWAIFNSFFIATTVCSLVYIVAENKKEAVYCSLIFILIIISTIKKGFIKEGVLWMTGSVNYLWPFALALTGFSLLKSCTSSCAYNKKAIIIFSVFFLSSFSEQMVVVNVILLTLITLVYHGPVRRIAVISLLATVMSLLYIILSPGNALRLHLEVSRWNPDFVNLNILEKIVMGLNLSYDQMFSVQPVALVIIYICLSILFPKKTKAKYLSLFILILSISLALVQKKLFSALEFDTIYQFNSQNINDVFSLARATGVILISILTTILLFLYHKERKTAWVIATTYVSSYAGTVMLGLSPTIYASEQRVLMVSGIMFSALGAYLVTKTIKCRKIV